MPKGHAGAKNKAADSFLSVGKVVIMLRGRYAGRKAVIVDLDKPSTEKGGRPFPSAFVAGCDKYPLKVTATMSKKKIARRSKIKPFLKHINLQHVMPTRYELALPGLEKSYPAADANNKDTIASRTTSRIAYKKALEGIYNARTNKWFFTKLRF
eukprot:gnl/Spiro4/22695_TR11204_c0_g1_i1.p1 gnl/Spiro4/22695_TR11204_c0_g1~~gnl/Spiro4/22695_TR11204_c0_g1_i1.p1  ORF type:complete len:168 (-),score=39.91 gnl/Spiro4/22695_TR11204_c0_g1_i1:74-535(-)